MTEPRIVGREELVEKRSAVDGEGRWRAEPIEGLRFRPTRPGASRGPRRHRGRAHESFVVFDGRVDSPTAGALNEFKVSERNPPTTTRTQRLGGADVDGDPP